MTRIPYATKGDTPFQQVLGTCERVMWKWVDLEEDLIHYGRLSVSLKEQVRRTLAEVNSCEYCKRKGKPDELHINERQVVATGFAVVFQQLNGEIPDAVFARLQETFTNEEVVELIAWITFANASQQFGAAVKLGSET
ncbi:carboxymuconolactone decarboxylase family protein [Geomicrobium sp. JSM 1781026]|uniref:carboxymuconolactone decarboxylase family protein n=1 Tax=Geomicrobium sp. JSM 1781026 TaxID=3344580 RepID=UPI0035BFCD99